MNLRRSNINAESITTKNHINDLFDDYFTEEAQKYRLDGVGITKKTSKKNLLENEPKYFYEPRRTNNLRVVTHNHEVIYN